MAELTFSVSGRPAPQGSKTPIGNGRMRESSKYLKKWREAVQMAAFAAARYYNVPRFESDVDLMVTFALSRPKGHFRTGRNAHLLRASAPSRPSVVPDLSKLVRATEDAITDAGVWRDDALVVSTHAQKVYAGMPGGRQTPGAWITIREAEPVDALLVPVVTAEESWQ